MTTLSVLTLCAASFVAGSILSLYSGTDDDPTPTQAAVRIFIIGMCGVFMCLLAQCLLRALEGTP